MFQCHVCGQGPRDGVSTYRQNEKGQPGVFACIAHTQKSPDELVAKIVAQIERKGIDKGELH